MDALTATLRAVGVALHGARDPWWVIGSAAVRLHGVDTDASDVDVMASVRDAEALCAAWGREPSRNNDGGTLFRSTVFERFDHLPLTVEIMGGLHLFEGAGWRPVRLAGDRMDRIAIADTFVFVPSREALHALLRRFGREKDMKRAALLYARQPVH